jgi:hypothetical protein
MTRQEIPALIVGTLLLIFGGSFIWRHIRTRQDQLRDESLVETDHEYLGRQFRRRLQASSLVCLIGILILVGDLVIPWGRGGRGDKVAAAFWFAIYWGGIILLALWVMLLALGDYFSIRVNSSVKLSRLKAQEKSLRRELERLREERERS